MPSLFQYQVRPAVWINDEMAIANIRHEVFITEQCVPESLEWETEDPAYQWFVAETRSGLIGIARLMAEPGEVQQVGRIGRMAVRRPFRGKGVGRALLAAAIDSAREQGLQAVKLSAQTHAVNFYVKYGFVAEGDIYMDAGIPHRTMRRILEEGRG
jgi:predicted GNAT family N-acyltransferase